MRVVVMGTNHLFERVVTDEPCDVVIVSEAAKGDRAYKLDPEFGVHVIGKEAVDAALADGPIGGFDDGSTYEHARRLEGKEPKPGTPGEVVSFKPNMSEAEKRQALDDLMGNPKR